MTIIHFKVFHLNIQSIKTTKLTAHNLDSGLILRNKLKISGKMDPFLLAAKIRTTVNNNIKADFILKCKGT